MNDQANPENGQVDAGPGWYEFILPGGSTTHIVYVRENGSIYIPEGRELVDEWDVRTAMGTNRWWKLVRAEDQEEKLRSAAKQERESIASDIQSEHSNAAKLAASLELKFYQIGVRDGLNKALRLVVGDDE